MFNKIRHKKVNKFVKEVVAQLNKANFSREEIIAFLSQLLTRIGYSLYYRYERKDLETPKDLLTGEEIEALWLNDATAGSSLMKLGFDIQDVLLKMTSKETS